jgi:hypothetical protein
LNLFTWSIIHNIGAGEFCMNILRRVIDCLEMLVGEEFERWAALVGNSQKDTVGMLMLQALAITCLMGLSRHKVPRSLDLALESISFFFSFSACLSNSADFLIFVHSAMMIWMKETGSRPKAMHKASLSTNSCNSLGE